MISSRILHVATFAFAATLSCLTSADQIDDFIAARMKMQHIPGLSIAILKDGKLTRAQGYGYSNLSAKQRVRPETTFLLGSLSKQFLATAVMRLVEQGKVRLDDRISRYVQGLPASWDEITVRQILSHTSGLVREAPNFDPTKPQTVAGVIEAAKAAPLASIPGSTWSYSNVGYYIVAQILESVSGQPWMEFMESSLFSPFGLTHTKPANTPAPELATGYDRKRREFLPAEKWPSIRPSGAFQSSVLDLAKWAIALDSSSLLNAANRMAMVTPTKLSSGSPCDYGLGWFVDQHRGRQHIYHGGGVPGFQSELHRFPQDGVTVIVLANTVGVDLDRIALTVAGMVQPNLAVPTERPSVDDAPKETLRVSKILQQLAAGKVDTDQFGANLAGLLKEDLQNGLQDSLKDLGPLRSVSLMSRSDTPKGLSRRFLVTRKRPFFEIYVTCVYGADGRIVGFSISD